MSTNISKEKREQLIAKISEIKAFIEKSADDKNKSNLLSYMGDLQKELINKHYGLIFEEHRERIDEILSENLPILTEEKDLFIDNGGQQNFLIEGDNLASLQLLEKTHRGKIDLIYIDPPYNTGNSFIYDDHIVDETDSFKHSKWISFMEKRLKISKVLLSKNGLIFISIDDKEEAVLRVLCDSIFGEDRFLTTIGWEKRTKCQNTKTSRKMLQPKVEYIFVYKNYDERAEFNCHVIGENEYPETDSKGNYRQEEIGQMSASGIRGRGSMIFPILDVYPRPGNQWKIGQDTVNEFLERKDLVKIGDKVYRKIRPDDESSDKIKPFWALFGAEQYGTAESAKGELSRILDNKEHGFETVKPSQLIEDIIFQSTSNNSTILDFFAGSGTTGQAVMDTNKDYGGSRKFILCTNNENSICRDVTYERIKRVIQKENYAASLKYFRVEYIPITDRVYYDYADQLLEHTKELVELENAVNFTGNAQLAIILSEDELDSFCADKEKISRCKKIYLGHECATTAEQDELFVKQQISVIRIPNYYYKED